MRVGIIMIPGSPWSELAARARIVEEAGFDTLATGDHLRHPFDPAVEFLDGWTVLAGWATATTRVRLAMLVSNAIYRIPAVLAKQVIAVDHLASGRLDVGVGCGVFDTDHAMAGVPPWSLDERIERTEELLTILDRLLRGVVDDFDGRWYRVGDAAVAPPPVQSPRPPLVVGANHSRMLGVAARHADVWNTWGGYGVDAAEFVRLTKRRVELVDKACDDAGRDPASLERSVLVHHAAFDPWTSADAFRSIVEQFEVLGFDECVFHWPDPHERAVFDEVVAHVLPDLRGGQPAPSQTDGASPRSVVERYVAVVNDCDYSGLAAVLADDCRADEPAGALVGRDALVANLRRWHEQFPGMRLSADDLIVDGDRVVWEWRLRAVHVTGRPVDVRGTIVFRVRDGRIVEYRGVFDQRALERQLAGS